MASHTSHRNGGMLVHRNELSMPKWVAEQSNRVGPRPPPPPLTPEIERTTPKQQSLPPKTKLPEPDYEVIEFSNQQYSNTPLRPNSTSSGSKTPDNKLKCTLCGSGNPWVTCDECAQQIFCSSCDDMFHKHPKRKAHQRKTLEKSLPPLPPKVLPGVPGPSPPVAPPRRNKRGFMTPILQRKDQGNTVTGAFPEPTSPTPSVKNSSWQERLGSLPRGMNLLNRPLPETPKTPSESSRSTTPKSVFDNIQRPPSVALEKIKSKANATLDRMQILQQRYRQQKEQMEKERGGSLTEQNMSAFDQWSSISQSPSHFRSGSMSSGINSSHLDLMDDNNFNLFHQRQMALQNHQMAAQRGKQLCQRAMSSSVFNLNQINRKQPAANNGWLNNSLQQAQSMAQLNCTNCGHHQQQLNGFNQHHLHKASDPWNDQIASHQHLNRSNMSLNVPAGFMMQQQMNNMYPLPAFMNQRNLMSQMHPQPYMGGMPVMNPGVSCMPPSNSRAASRAGSRMASPAMSRRSVTLRRKQRSNYVDDEATDDEDSDEDDRRSIASTRSGVSRSRQRLLSNASQFQRHDDIESTQTKLHHTRLRSHRRDSVTKSTQNDWALGRGTSSVRNRSGDSGFNSPLKVSRIYSDLDSESSGTRALVQAKIQQKLKEESLKRKDSKSKRQSKSPPPQKTSAAVQTPAVKQTDKRNKTDDQVRQAGILSDTELKDITLVIAKKESTDIPEKLLSETKVDEYETQENKQSDGKQENGETPHLDEGKIQEDDLGPPPSTPEHEWECEFCTFVNEANIKICSICCKTPSVKPKEIKKSISPPKQIKAFLNKEEQHHTKDKNTAPIEPETFSQRSTTNNSELTIICNNTQGFKTSSAHNGNDDKTIESQKTKESLEDIWATLDESIQATANVITRNAQSKTSPKAHSIGSSSSTLVNVEREQNDLEKSQAREMGTSPPPQNISTQTYDILPIHKIETKQNEGVKPIPQSMFNDTIQHPNFPFSPKIQDLKSFEDEVLNKIHNISHTPLHYQNHYAHHITYSQNDRQRYRSNNDLRIDDNASMDFEPFNGLGKRHPSINELLLTSPQTHSPCGGSTYDIPYRETFSVRPNDMQNHKESDLYKYTTEELNAALRYCGPDMHPLVWLRDNWPKLIQTVQSLATKYGQERAENTIGTISQIEAREALRLHTGNIWQAVSECIEQRQRKYREILSKGNFSREDIVTALTTQQGNVELALLDLGRTQLTPFLMRIWGAPGGVENESGSQSLLAPAHSSPPSNIDKDIHNFLSANASDCTQTPNATGVSPFKNQMPSPFDLPVPLHSLPESNKISTYTTDSLQPIDESMLSNKNVLKDLETLIGNMEHKQSKQNEEVLRSIQDMVNNISLRNGSEYDSESMRILSKSPIISSKLMSTARDNNSKTEDDVKNFVRQHIQDIVPDLVKQVEMELVDDIANEQNSVGETNVTISELKQTAAVQPPPPIDQDEFLMEEVIKPNIKNASIREELPPQYCYTAEIATFQFTFDKCLEREHRAEFEYETLEEAPRHVYKLFRALEGQSKPQIPKANLQPTTIETSYIDQPQTHVALDGNQLEQIELQSEAISENSQQFLTSDLPNPPLNRNTDDGLIKLETNVEILMENENVNENQSPFETPNVTGETSRTPSEIRLGENDTQTIILLDTANKNDEITNQSSLTILAAPCSDTNGESKVVHLRHKANNKSKVRTANANQYKQPDTAESFKKLDHARPKTELKEIINHDLMNLNVEQESPRSTSSFSIPERELNIISGNLSANLVQPSPKDSKNESMGIKRISKIPVRRTASNNNLINFSTMSNNIDTNVTTKSQELEVVADIAETGISQSISRMIVGESGAEEVHVTETSSRDDYFRSPNTSNEMLFLIQQEELETTHTLALSTSSSTLHSTISQSSSFKSPADFIPSGDPSKQNLTELVEDTQRLIKQMKDEISIDDFESSTDDGEYSDEFSDEYYDDGEEEEEEYWEEEEGEEYEDITEENEDLSVEEDSISNTQTPLQTPESQDQRETHNNSALSNKTVSSNHSLSYDHVEDHELISNKNSDIQNQNPIIDEIPALVESENNLPELPVETVIADNLENSQSSMQHIDQKEQSPAEMSVEALMLRTYSGTLSNFEEQLASSPSDVPLYSSTMSIELETASSAKQDLIAAPLENTTHQSKTNTTSETLIQQINTSEYQTDSTTIPYDLPLGTTSSIISPLSEQDQLDETGNNRITAIEETQSGVQLTKKSTKLSQGNKNLNKDVKTSTKKPISKIPKPKEITKEPKQKKDQPAEPKIDFKKKYIRSKSFSGPSTPIGIASVKTISQKFASAKPHTQVMVPKMYSTVARKSSITETINKFTKPSANSEKPAGNTVFKSRTQPRIPKKKYHETCFSDDDYESSTQDEETEPLELRQRKLSVPVFKTYPSIQESELVNTEELVEKFTRENMSTSVAEAQIAAALVCMKFPQDASLWAAKECSDLDHAIALLKQECELCSGTYALNQIVSMLKCTHKCCKQCAKTYFTVQITERSINDCSCPFCKLPELHNQSEYEDENLEYFSNLDIFLKSILEPGVHELFQRKLRDRTLLKDPNFKWCVQCSSGFFARPKQKRLICPDCGSVTCAHCRKTWQKQHEGISCDRFSEWEAANDPELQAKGVQQHLEQNGIDCPKCKFKYSLARGGCMHFTCTQCKYEFCYGCAKPFKMGAKCTISSYCAKLGLHAHHPRNCLFYLRDKLPVQLQILLKNNGVSFEVDPIKAADSVDSNGPSSSKKKDLLCTIPIQKETPTGLVDTRCNGDVPDKHAGMCRNHYVEYLTAKVATAKIDPLPIFDLTDCVQELRRRGIPLPERGPWDTDEIYKNMCAEVIQKNIPLNMD